MIMLYHGQHVAGLVLCFSLGSADSAEEQHLVACRGPNPFFVELCFFLKM